MVSISSAFLLQFHVAANLPTPNPSNFPSGHQCPANKTRRRHLSLCRLHLPPPISRNKANFSSPILRISPPLISSASISGEQNSPALSKSKLNT
ncbi:hypothetical protein M5689_000228 [Euphorbia peplus]|nr:hypothetical protein M5689_000228 [Euphorbia peplus]